MTLKWGAFVPLLIFAFGGKEVGTWSVDLPEVRKYFFEKYSDNERSNVVGTDTRSFDNVHGDSPHNTHQYRELGTGGEYHAGTGDKYAAGYEYQSYMEKKVSEAARGGAAYLEGLSAAVQRYGDTLRNCSQYSISQGSPSANSTWLPENESPLPDNSTGASPERTACERATRAAEHVRRLAALALWASRELEDRAYSDQYRHRSEHAEEEEAELVIRLAWFLDRLATLTGFESAPFNYTTDAGNNTTTTTAAPYPSLFNDVPEDVKLSMIRCLAPPVPADSGSSSSPPPPAYERCRFPLPLPDTLRQLFNISSDEVSAATTSPSVVQPPPSAEVLEPGASGRSITKRSIDDNPLLHVVQYYVKHKAWLHSHDRPDSSEVFDVDNHLTSKSVRKRAVDSKKSTVHLLRDISSYVKHRAGAHYEKDESQAETIKLFLDKIYHHGAAVKSHARRLVKVLRPIQELHESLRAKLKHKRPVEEAVEPHKYMAKRSVHYEDMFKPRASEDPQQDIGYYVKNKPGTRRRPDTVQAAQVRAGLQQVMETGNIEVVRRYGANYNPAVANPLLAGIVRMMADV